MDTEARLTAIIKHALLMGAHADINVTAQHIASELILNCDIKPIPPKRSLGRRAPITDRKVALPI
jgi:hypothetical protein